MSVGNISEIFQDSKFNISIALRDIHVLRRFVFQPIISVSNGAALAKPIVVSVTEYCVFSNDQRKHKRRTIIKQKMKKKTEVETQIITRKENDSGKFDEPSRKMVDAMCGAIHHLRILFCTRP